MKSDLFAVIGNPISHSLSPDMMNYAFRQMSHDACYKKILTDSLKDIEYIRKLLPLKGVNVTAPLKFKAAKYCNETSVEVKETKACNTIKFIDGEAYGYNTDIAGIINPILARNRKDIKRVLLFGTGGAAAAAIIALQRTRVEIFVAGRSKNSLEEISKECLFTFINIDSFEESFESFDLIINTIPLFIENFKKLTFYSHQMVLDASYKVSPLKILAEKGGAEYINGQEWLIEQAREAYYLFTSHQVQASTLIEGINSSLSNNCDGRIVLTGPMGAGKSSLGKKLAEKLGYEFFDIDQHIEINQREKINKIFNQKGEEFFRDLESEALIESMNKRNVVIASGGGIVLRETNRKILKNAHVIFLLASPSVSHDRINDGLRPLLELDDPLMKLEQLFEERKNHYLTTADVIVNSSYRSIQELLSLIYEDYSKSFDT